MPTSTESGYTFLTGIQIGIFRIPKKIPFFISFSQQLNLIYDKYHQKPSRILEGKKQMTSEFLNNADQVLE